MDTESILCHLLKPSEEGRPSQDWRDLTRLVPSQLAHKVNGLGTPPASSLQSNNNQLTARAVEQFGAFPLFVGSGSLQHDTIDVSCPGCGQTHCGQCTPWSDVDSELRALMERKTCGPTPQWPAPRWPPRRRSCREVSCSFEPSHQPLGMFGQGFVLVPRPSSATSLNVGMRPCSSRTRPRGRRIRTWPQSHQEAVAISPGTNVLNKCGSIVNSNVVGAPCNAALDPGPEWDLMWAWMAGHDWAKTTDSLKWCSREEDPWYCQPCCHSPGSTPLGCGGRTPPLNSLQLGRPTNPLLSRMPAASSKSLRHPCGLAFKIASTPSVNSGRRADNMGKASAHEAQ